jgi:tRNA threonylcarbamoyl adenosine modification protein (Sua5/YciO/YrdC/YwlC family)
MASLFDVRDDHYALTGLHQAHAAVSRGEVIVVPTDTVYGVAVCPQVAGAIDRVVELKGRGRDMAPPILVTQLEQAAPFLAQETVNDALLSLTQQFWPGALTIVVPVNPDLAIDIGSTPGTVALRSPDHPALLDLLRIHGPLAVTSANRTGEPPCRSVFEAINVFGDGVSVYLDGGSDSDTDHLPSTIVDATALSSGEKELRIIRLGAISEQQLIDAGFSVVSP